MKLKKLLEILNKVAETSPEKLEYDLAAIIRFGFGGKIRVKTGRVTGCDINHVTKRISILAETDIPKNG